MKKTLFALGLAAWAVTRLPAMAAVEKVWNEPDSVYLFSYAQATDAGRSGLKFAWSPDGEKWMEVSEGLSLIHI